MKKLFLCAFLVLIFYNTALAESSLPECEGNDKDISEFSVKHFRMMRKWKNCQGTAISPKGAKYIGEFYDGKFHGQGTFIGENGRKYVGQYKKHKRHGQGTYTYANGDKYVGEWKKGLRHGKGTFVHANKKVDKGIWKEDKLIKSKQ